MEIVGVLATGLLGGEFRDPASSMICCRKTAFEHIGDYKYAGQTEKPEA